MKIAVLKERRFNETRVAATPETVKKLAALKHMVAIEAAAARAAYFPSGPETKPSFGATQS